HVQKSALAAAGWAQQRHEFTIPDIERNLVKGENRFPVSRPIGVADADAVDTRAHANAIRSFTQHPPSRSSSRTSKPSLQQRVNPAWINAIAQGCRRHAGRPA